MLKDDWSRLFELCMKQAEAVLDEKVPASREAVEMACSLIDRAIEMEKINRNLERETRYMISAGLGRIPSETMQAPDGMTKET